MYVHFLSGVLQHELPGHIYLLSCYRINIDAKDKLTCIIKL